MLKPEIVLVTLSDGSVALFVGTSVVMKLESSNRPNDVKEVGSALATALDTEMTEIEMEVPSDPDWNWLDVLELIPARQLPRIKETEAN